VITSKLPRPIPIPTVCADKQSTDWFHAIARTLKWNERERQKSFVVVEESPAKTQGQTPLDISRVSLQDLVKEDSEDKRHHSEADDHDGEEKFDIDDSNTDGASEPSSEAEVKDNAQAVQAKAQNAAASLCATASDRQVFWQRD